MADLRKQMAAITTKRLIQFGKDPNNFRMCKSPYYTVAFSFENATILFRFYIPSHLHRNDEED